MTARKAGLMPHEVDAEKVLDWAASMFGPIARDRNERACRFLEEAIELAQAEGLDMEIVNAITARVYSREPGPIHKEIGQARMTLDCLAKNIGLDAQMEERREWDRVRTIPKEEWQRRHRTKVRLGIAANGILVSAGSKSG
jgi:hypothetical protein